LTKVWFGLSRPLRIQAGGTSLRPNSKSLPGGESRLWHRVKVDSGIGLSTVNVLESTLEWTKGEVIVNSGIGSHEPCFSLDSASGMSLLELWPLVK
jgi:hypothetical protein